MFNHPFLDLRAADYHRHEKESEAVNWESTRQNKPAARRISLAVSRNTAVLLITLTIAFLILIFVISYATPAIAESPVMWGSSSTDAYPSLNLMQ